MQRLSYKISLNDNIPIKKSNPILYFLRGVALVLAFSFSPASISSAFSNNPTATSSGATTGSPPAQSKPLQDIIDICEEDIESAEQATLGLDMQSYVAMTQVTTQVSSATSSSAKTGHQASALINGTMAINAQKRCSKCKKAVKTCQASCNSETQCQQISGVSSSTCVCGTTGYNCPPPANGLPGQYDSTCVSSCQDACKTCEDTLEDSLKKCNSYGDSCGQACSQAVLSALQSMINLAAARKLGNCKGDDCKQVTDSDDSNNPNPNNPDSPSFSGSSTLTEFDTDEGAVSTNPISTLSGSDTKTGGNNKIADDNKNGGGHYFGRDVLSNEGSGPQSLPGSSSSIGSMAGGIPSSGLQASLGNKDKKNPYKKFKNRNEEEDIDLAQSGFSGGSLTGYQTASAPSGRLYRRHGGKSSEKTKRGVSGETDSQAEGSDQNFKDTIFVRASRLIVNFCDNSKC